MAQGSGFYKGEKKKKKKGSDGKPMIFSTAPTFVLPEIISKKKKWDEQ